MSHRKGAKMPSLSCKIKRLCYKGVISKKDCDRIVEALKATSRENEILSSAEPNMTWVTGADGAKIAFKDVPVWKVTKICEILGEPQESEEV